MEKLFNIIKNLVSVDTSNPPGNEYLLKDYIVNLYKDIGLKVKIVVKSKKRPNIIGQIGSGKKKLGIFCHTDTVLAGEGWKSDPFKLKITSDKIIGRGVVDDKGPIAVAYLALKKFLQNNFDKSKYNISFICLSDEEEDNVYGIKYLIKKGLNIDEALVLDGIHKNKIDIGEKGCIQLKVYSYGRQEHSALAKNPKNAISNLVKLASEIENINWPSNYNKLFTPVNVNISRFKGGNMANVVPSLAECQMDIRYPFGIKAKEVLKIVKEELKKISKLCKAKFKLDVIYITNPHLYTGKDLSKCLKNAGKQNGIIMKEITVAGNSFAKELNEAGIGAICHVPFRDYPAHEPNEYAYIDDLKQGIELYRDFFVKYFALDKDNT